MKPETESLLRAELARHMEAVHQEAMNKIPKMPAARILGATTAICMVVHGTEKLLEITIRAQREEVEEAEKLNAEIDRMVEQ